MAAENSAPGCDSSEISTVEADTFFPKRITHLLSLYTSKDGEATENPLEAPGSGLIEEQWAKALALIKKRDTSRHAIRTSCLEGVDPSSKKARLLRLVTKSRSDASFDRQESATPWFLKNRNAMTENDWKIMREDFGICVTGVRAVTNASHKHSVQSTECSGLQIPPPIRCWEECDIPRAIREMLYGKLRITRPSPIQMQAIPIIRSGQDIIARAETGSGKSIAFILPVLLNVMGTRSSETPYALFLAPTQELARQLHQVISLFAEAIGLRCARAIGGESSQSNAAEIRHGAQCLVGTPGRVHDLIEGGMLALSGTSMVVIDEADRCTDSGLVDDLRKVLSRCTKSRDAAPQLLFFSATYGESMAVMEGLVRPNALVVRIGGSTSRHIRQRVESVGNSHHETISTLIHQYIQRHDPPIIIFCNSRESCDALSARLDAQEVSSTVLHAGLSSSDRQSIFKAFREKRTPILITTDALARGVDVEGISLVVNFEAPVGDDALGKYVHRIGRTGRGGKSGVAVTFIRKGDRPFVCSLRSYLMECSQSVSRDVESVYQKAKGDSK